MMGSSDSLGPVIVLVGLLIVIPCVILYRRLYAIPREQRRAEALAARELANIIEEVKPTPGGTVCMGMVVLTAFGSFVMFVASNTIFQQIEAGVLWIGGTIMFGIGAALGQRRSYTIYRSTNRMD
jgi:hypothetical protein